MTLSICSSWSDLDDPSRRLAGVRVAGIVSSPSKSTTAVVIVLEVDAPHALDDADFFTGGDAGDVFKSKNF